MRHFKVLALASLMVSTSALASDRDRAGIDHVLLVSVDGLHALDVARFVESHPHSALATLSRHGTTYTSASLPANSDSFPGLLALVTGGSPISHGVFYDVSYDRSLFDPANVSCAGQPGNTVVFDESIDAYDAAHVSLDVIDPSKLPRRLNAQGKCVPVYPHDFIKANTLFEVVRRAGGETAWADKHAAYDLVNGPSGQGVTDLFTPEITNVDGFDATASVVCTAQNDQKKVAAVLNQIHGRNHDGTRGLGVPAVFGLNFQAVSVGQKLTKDNFDSSCTIDDPLSDTRTPDIIVQPIDGTIYSTSAKKVAEHGGFSFGDTNVGLIVSNPRRPARILKTPVVTSQVAPTILKALGLEPNALQAVRREGTLPLPGWAE